MPTPSGSSTRTKKVIEQARERISNAERHILRANATVRRVQDLLENCHADQLIGLTGRRPPKH